MTQPMTAKPSVGYVVVFRDHAGDWHAVTSAFEWADASAAHGVLVNTLIATDYYADCGPDVAKIVDTEREGYVDYASAPAEADAPHGWVRIS